MRQPRGCGSRRRRRESGLLPLATAMLVAVITPTSGSSLRRDTAGATSASRRTPFRRLLGLDAERPPAPNLDTMDELAAVLTRETNGRSATEVLRAAAGTQPSQPSSASVESRTRPTCDATPGTFTSPLTGDRGSLSQTLSTSRQRSRGGAGVLLSIHAGLSTSQFRQVRTTHRRLHLFPGPLDRPGADRLLPRSSDTNAMGRIAELVDIRPAERSQQRSVAGLYLWLRLDEAAAADNYGHLFGPIQARTQVREWGPRG